MNKQEKQYNDYLINLGYNPKFFPEKNGFLLKEENIYLKCTPYPITDLVRKQALEASKKIDVILLDGNLTFKQYEVFRNGEEVEAVLLIKGSKYGNFFYDVFNLEYFDNECFAIAKAIVDKDLICPRCKSKNNYKVEKNLHFKATCRCGTFITNISANKPPVIHFGKYQGREISSMVSNDEVNYLNWAVSNSIFNKKLTEAAIAHLNNSI